MKTITKRATSIGVSLAAVGAIVAGSFAFAANVDRSDVEPAPTIVATTPALPEPAVPDEVPVDGDQLDEARAAKLQREAEAAAAEAARIVAEQEAAAAEAARIAAEQEAQRVAEQNTQQGTTPNSNGGGEAQPAPEPAPAPLKTCPAGTTAVEYDGAGNAVGCMDPACFTGEVEGNDPRCVVVRP